MEINVEKRTCQNCKEIFHIEPEDFDFYKKLDVSPPTFCPSCRFQRRLMFRNENVLYKRTCGLCGKSIVSVFAPDPPRPTPLDGRVEAGKPFPVYCGSCWWSDQWDAAQYAQEYDPKRPFWEQFRELQQKVPYMNLIVSYETMVMSEYTNHAGGLKNCYLVYNADFCENVLYANLATSVKDSMDATILEHSELCYDVVNCSGCYRTFFSEDCTECHDTYFSKDCVGCSNCFGCIGLRNQNYCIFNKQYSRMEYEEKIQEYKMDSFASIQKWKKEVPEFWLQHPRKFYHGLHNVHVSGDYVYESKNSHHMYLCRQTEDSKFCQMMTLAPAKDLYDLTEWGNGAQRIYDSITVGEGADNVKFSFGVWKESANVEYSMFVINSSNILGCVNLRKKQYCILNKEYPREKFLELREHILKELKSKPYVDSKGREWKYGEFFPYDVSLFDYNESTAPHFFDISKEKALEHGWRWREGETASYPISLKPKNLPDAVDDAAIALTNEIIGCAKCGKAYRIIKQELELLRQFPLPLPRTCPNCRYKDRLHRLNPPKLWKRLCQCVGSASENKRYANTAEHFHKAAPCTNRFQTSYSPDRPEIVYCEECYNAEIT